MKLTYSILLAILLLLSVNNAWTQRSTLLEQIQHIQELQDHSQYQQSYNQCKETLKIHHKILRKKKNREANIKVLLLKGKAEYQLAKYPTSIATLLQVKALADKKFRKPNVIQHELLNHLATVYFEMNYTIRAKNIADSLVAIYDKLPPTSALSFTYELLGYLYGLDSQFVLSKQYLTKAFEIRESLPFTSEADLLRSYYSMATLHFEKGNFQFSYDYIQKGLDKLKNYQHPLMEGKHYAILGNLLRYIGDYNTAEQYYQNAQKLFDKCIPRFHSSSLYLQNSIGGLLSDRKKDKEAVNHYRKLIHFIEEEAPWQDTSVLIQVYANIAQNQISQDTIASRLALDTAITLLNTQAHKDFTSTSLYLQLTNIRANLNYSMNNFSKSIQDYTFQIKKVEEEYDSSSTVMINSLNNLGLTYNLTKEYIKARNCFSRGLQILRWKPETEDPFAKILSPFKGSYLMWNRAEIYELLAKQFNDESYAIKAYEDYHSYLAFLDHMRNGYREEGSKLILASENKIAYERALINLLKLKTMPYDWKERAFSYFERSRALVLHDAFRSQGQVEFPGLENIQEKEEMLKKEVQLLQNQYEEAQSSLFITEEIKNEVKDRLFQAKYTFFNFLDLLKELHPNYYNLKYQIGNLSLSNVKEKCAQQDKGVLFYFVGKSTLFSMLVTAENTWVKSEMLDYPLQQWVDSLNISIQGKNQRSQYIKHSTRLYDKLIAPWEGKLPERLSIVADGTLQSLPFDALLYEYPENPLAFKEYPFLISKYCISYDFSATMDKATYEKKHSERSRDSVLVFAPFSDFPKDTLADLFSQFKMDSDNIIRKELDPLLYGGVEAYGVTQYFPGKIFFGTTATKDNFLDNSATYRMYHFTSHAQSLENPDSSYILFAPSGLTSSYDTLFVKEIYGLTLNADQVNLSGCQTGLGGDLTGEGVSSLARAFIYAGAKTVVYTLWEVLDVPTAQIMISMTEKMAASKERDMALRDAKLEYISTLKENRYAHPRYWAGIVVVGDSESAIP